MLHLVYHSFQNQKSPTVSIVPALQNLCKPVSPCFLPTDAEILPTDKVKF